MRSSRPLPALSPRYASINGGVLAAGGLCLILMMSGLIILFTQVILGYPTIAGQIGFTGGPVVAGVILMLFAAMLAFGLAALYSGVWQIRHKRRHPRMLVVAEYAFTGLAILGTLACLISVFADD
jgi:hypothetical protein